ncbi:MAG: hypothetical protein SCALA702_34050 [Melioribacteraceae bacterium]|nr:MAG: hypothetical protein SCALA702_34050 [Melioribacteraceae bacterium]
MKVIYLFLLLSALVFGQSNLYWQNGYFPNHVKSVRSVSKTKHYYIRDGKRIQYTEDNFKTSQDVGSFHVKNWTALFYHDYAIYLTAANTLARYNFSTSLNDDLGQSTAHIFLKYSNNLLYYQDEEGDIYHSEDLGETWLYVKNATKIESWGTSGKGYIYCSDNNKDIYRVDSLFGGKTVMLSNSALGYRQRFYTAGADTVCFFAGSKLYRSFDSGSTFIVEDLGRPDHSLEADSEGNLYVLLNNRLLKSSDKGDNWEEILFKRDNYGFFYINGNTIHLRYGNDNRTLYLDPEVNCPDYENFFPLEVGNKWLYQSLSGSNRLKTVEVYDSVRIGDKKYFRISDFNSPLRYEDNKLLFYRSEADHIYIDFNIPSGHRVLYRLKGLDFSMWEGSYELFDSTLYYKGPFFATGIERMGTIYSPGIGKIFNADYEIFGGTILENYDTVLVQAVIHSDGGIVEYNDVPAPQFSGIVDVSYQYYGFKIITDVVHEMPGMITIERNMIDTVRMDYIYAKGSDTQSPGHVFGKKQYGLKYLFTDPLQEDLINDGYLLKFRFTAWTEGIIPVYSQYPPKGYITTDGITVSMEDENLEEKIFQYNLKNNYPNPFNPSTKINYSLAKSSFVTLDVYNIQGERVSSIVKKQQVAGEYNVKFDGSDLASGVYIAKLRATSGGNEVFTKSIKMILMK